MMVEGDELHSRIHTWVLATFPLAQQQSVGFADSLLDSGIIDSLGTLEVVQYLEDEFGITVLDDEMVADHFNTIESIARYIQSKQSG